METDKTVEKPWLFKKGQPSANPNGRPKGSISMKEYAKRYLMGLSDVEKEEFMDGLPKDVIWKMAEGNPETNTDITSKGEAVKFELVNKDGTIFIHSAPGAKESFGEQS